MAQWANRLWNNIRIYIIFFKDITLTLAEKALVNMANNHESIFEHYQKSVVILKIFFNMLSEIALFLKFFLP